MQLKQETLTERIERRTLGWYGHVQRMTEHRRSKRVIEARPDGRPWME